MLLISLIEEPKCKPARQEKEGKTMKNRVGLRERTLLSQEKGKTCNGASYWQDSDTAAVEGQRAASSCTGCKSVVSSTLKEPPYVDESFKTEDSILNPYPLFSLAR